MFGNTCPSLELLNSPFPPLVFFFLPFLFHAIQRGVQAGSLADAQDGVLHMRWHGKHAVPASEWGYHHSP